VPGEQVTPGGPRATADRLEELVVGRTHVPGTDDGRRALPAPADAVGGDDSAATAALHEAAVTVIPPG
jgi:hypothetical protein